MARQRGTILGPDVIKTLCEKAAHFTRDERAGLHKLLLLAEAYCRDARKLREYGDLLTDELILLQVCTAVGDIPTAESVRAALPPRDFSKL